MNRGKSKPQAEEKITVQKKEVVKTTLTPEKKPNLNASRQSKAESKSAPKSRIVDTPNRQ